MAKLKNIKVLTMLVLTSAMILTGCGNRMFDKAVEQGKLAMAAMEYEKARASFQLALEEKEDDEVKAMLEEVNNMVAGLEAKENDNIEEAIEHFSKITKEDNAFPSMAEEADKIGQELQKTKEKISHYEKQVAEAESFIKEKQYAEGKKFLSQLIEETKDQKVLIVVHEKAQGALEQIHIEVAQVEEQKKEARRIEEQRKEEERKKQEEEAARQAELEKQKREISNAGLMDILVRGSDRLQESIFDGTNLDGQFFDEDSGYRTPYTSEFNSRTKIENYLSPYFSKSSIKNTLLEYTEERDGKAYYIFGESGNFNVYNDPYYEAAEIIERIDNENTIYVEVRVYFWDSSHTRQVTYAYENGKWVINSELDDWGTSPG